MMSHRYRKFKFRHGGQDKKCDLMVFVHMGRVVAIVNGDNLVKYKKEILESMSDKSISVNFLFIVNTGYNRSVHMVLPNNSVERVAELEVIERAFGIKIPL